MNGLMVRRILDALVTISKGKLIYLVGRIIALFVIAGVLVTVFIVLQFLGGDNATIPIRIFKKRSVAAAAWFTVCLGGSFFVLIYFIPIWFQAIKSVTATKSGIMVLPMILGLVLVSIVAGGAVTVLGYYTPFMIASSVFMAIGIGLISTWKQDTNHSRWIGYQVIYGIGGELSTLCSYVAAFWPSTPTIGKGEL